MASGYVPCALGLITWPTTDIVWLFFMHFNAGHVQVVLETYSCTWTASSSNLQVFPWGEHSGLQKIFPPGWHVHLLKQSEDTNSSPDLYVWPFTIHSSEQNKINIWDHACYKTSLRVDVIVKLYDHRRHVCNALITNEGCFLL